MKPNTLKKLLLSEIHSVSQRADEFAVISENTSLESVSYHLKFLLKQS